MISAAHLILYSKDPEGLRTFFRETLQLPFVDAGHGWLIFALPPAEVGVHPDDAGNRHELYLICDDLESTIQMLQAKGVETTPITDAGWGRVTRLKLQSGDEIGLYQPRHPMAIPPKSA